MSKITKEEAFKKIKELFGVADAVQLTDYKTADGKTITCDGELKVGAKLVTKDDAGNVSPVADGEYTLEDKRVVKCANGAVTEIVPAPAMPPAPATEVEVEMTEIKASIEKLYTDLKSVMGNFLDQEKENISLKEKITALETKLSTQETSNTELKNKVIEGFQIVEKIAAEPAAPAAKPKNIFSKTEEEKSKESQKFSSMADVISKMKNQKN